MRSSPSVPLVEILPGHDSREGSADMGGGTLYEPCLWGCRWCSLWGTIRARGVLQERGWTRKGGRKGRHTQRKKLEEVGGRRRGEEERGWRSTGQG